MDDFGDDEDFKDICALYGIVMYKVSAVEHLLALLLTTAIEFNPDGVSRSEANKAFDFFLTESFGQLVYLIREIPMFPEFEDTLSEAVEKRNFLVHHYFWERAEGFLTEEGQEYMKEELQSYNYFFTDIVRQLESTYLSWGEN